MTGAFSVSLPWPPQATSANGSQGKWRAKASAASDYRQTCAWLLRAAKVPKIDFVPVISITFCPPTKVSRFDLDNTLGRAKQGLDAVAEAIGVDDANWPTMILKRGPKGGNGSVLVSICPAPVMVEVVGRIS